MKNNGFFPSGRVNIFLICTSILVIAILVNYARLAAGKSGPQGERQPRAERGSIFDKNGKTLARKTEVFHIGVSKPQKIEQAEIEQFAKDMAPALEMTEEEISNRIKDASKEQRFTYIKKNLPGRKFDEISRITRENSYRFVTLDKEEGRFYPENSLASQLIGFRGEEIRTGVELSMDADLSPTQKTIFPGRVQHGNNVYLTIDANLQYKLEEIAHRALETTQAENLMLIAAHAKTGEILSYINLPEADLNNYGRANEEQRLDRAATTFFEPGSVFKVFSIAAAYDEGHFHENDEFVCDGVFEKVMTSGERVRLTCLAHHGRLTARGALEQSCNDVTAQITDMMETENFLAKLRAFGFGSKTGIQLPSESAGFFKNQKHRTWSARSKMTISIGQEIGVTALQIIGGATVLANGGRPVRLSVVSKITDSEGNTVWENQVERKEAIISEKTARYILSCMKTGAERGIGWRANPGDISIGVKTGTAQMAVPGGYSDTDFLSDVLAIFPTEDPEIILYIVVQKSRLENVFASRIVAPVIKESADAIIDHFGMSRGRAASYMHTGRTSIQIPEPISIEGVVPNFSGRLKSELLPLLDRKDLKINIVGNGRVKTQRPAPGTPVTENMEIELHLE